MCFNLISAFLLANLGCFTEAIPHSTIVSFRLGWNRTFNKLLLVGVLLFFHTHNVRVTIILVTFGNILYRVWHAVEIMRGEVLIPAAGSPRNYYVLTSI